MIKELLLAANDFKVTTHYWNHDVLTHEENSIRNYPAPWIRKTIEFLKIIGGKTVVEIGSTRMELTQRCVSYYDNSYNLLSKDAPPCCQDGHSTFFWAREGFETYTVDIDPRCKEILHSQYQHHVKEPIPSNLHIHVPQDGISFLQNFPGKIDLLYLDGWDKGTHEYAENHLKAYLAAKDKLASKHLVSIDDTDFNTQSAGKDKILTPYLISEGYTRLLWGRQNVFYKE